MEPLSSIAGACKIRSASCWREHEQVLTLFEKMRAVTGNFKMPEDGCESYRLLLTGLDELEMDTRLHIQKENEVLFPQVLALKEDSV